MERSQAKIAQGSAINVPLRLMRCGLNHASLCLIPAALFDFAVRLQRNHSAGLPL